MLLGKQFDAKRVMKTIEEICEVSEFLYPDAGGSPSASEMKRYLHRGKRRLTVVSKRFEEFGYKKITQEFNFRGLTATNALFTCGEISGCVILFAGHHDYCAGLGAEDNATALAMMLELGRCMGEEEQRIIFVSFDLEELGLLGSRHFVGSLFGKQLRALSGVVALECLGSGRDVGICKKVVGAKSDPVLVSKLQSCARKLGHRVVLENFGWFNSDHVPFAERGVRTVEVCSFNSENYKGGPDPSVNVAHSSFDVPKSIRPLTLQVIGEILLQFVYDY